LGGEKSPEMQKKGIPAASGRKKEEKRISVIRVWWAAAFRLGLSYLGPLANQLSFTIIPFVPKTKTHA